MRRGRRSRGGRARKIARFRSGRRRGELGGSGPGVRSMMGRRGRRARRDGRELSRPPRVRHPQDRRVFEEQVGMAARATDPGAERKLAPGPKRERPASDTAGFKVVRPDEIGRSTIAADRSQPCHPACASGGPSVKTVAEARHAQTRAPSTSMPEAPCSLRPIPRSHGIASVRPDHGGHRRLAEFRRRP
jgi:hypothetical protein